MPRYIYPDNGMRYGSTFWTAEGKAYQVDGNSPKALLMEASDNGQGVPQWVIDVAVKGKFHVISKGDATQGWELVNLAPNANTKPSIVMP